MRTPGQPAGESLYLALSTSYPGWHMLLERFTKGRFGPVRLCAYSRRSATALSATALLLAAFPALASNLLPITLKVAGSEVRLKPEPLSDGREVYLPLDAL